jgi:MFS family permease
MGAYAFVGAAGASIGTVLGGILTEVAGWPWIFFVNVPIGLVVIVLALRTLAPDEERRGSGTADALGGALVTAGLVLVVFTIVAETGIVARVGTGVLAVALLAAFVLRQRRIAAPLVDLRIFTSRAVTGGNIAQLLVVAGMMGFQFIVALYLQRSLGLPPAQAGLALLPVPLVIAAVSLSAAGRLIARFGTRAVLLTGEAVVVVGLSVLALAPAGNYFLGVLPVMVLLGIGVGLVLPAVTTVMMSEATPADAGLASGLANTSQQVGAALGTAVLAVVAAAHTDVLLGSGAGQVAALAGGYQLAFGVGAVLAAAGTLVTLTVLRRPVAAT